MTVQEVCVKQTAFDCFEWCARTRGQAVMLLWSEVVCLAVLWLVTFSGKPAPNFKLRCLCILSSQADLTSQMMRFCLGFGNHSELYLEFAFFINSPCWVSCTLTEHFSLYICWFLPCVMSYSVHSSVILFWWQSGSHLPITLIVVPFYYTAHNDPCSQNILVFKYATISLT